MHATDIVASNSATTAGDATVGVVTATARRGNGTSKIAAANGREAAREPSHGRDKFVRADVY